MPPLLIREVAILEQPPGLGRGQRLLRIGGSESPGGRRARSPWRRPDLADAGEGAIPSRVGDPRRDGALLQLPAISISSRISAKTGRARSIMSSVAVSEILKCAGISTVVPGSTNTARCASRVANVRESGTGERGRR